MPLTKMCIRDSSYIINQVLAAFGSTIIPYAIAAKIGRAHV